MSEMITFGSEHDRFHELSDWLQAFTSDLSSRLDSVRPEVLTGTGSWAGAASNPLLAVLDKFDASGSALVEVLRQWYPLIQWPRDWDSNGRERG